MKNSFLAGVTALSLASSSLQGANLLWVSFHSADNTPSAAAATAGFTDAPDAGYTQLLQANGHTVTRYLTRDNPDVSLLNSYDLVIISRSVNSGHYELDAETAAWNSVTAPMMLLGGYTLRNNRLGFTTGSGIPDTTGVVTLTINDPNHPIFDGVAITGNTMATPFATPVSFNGALQRGISVNTNGVAGGGTVLATTSVGSPAVQGMIIGEWQAGATLGNSPPDTLGGHRMVFLTGSREAAGLTSEGAGIYDLTADGSKVFLNAVNYMAVPEPSTIALSVIGAALLGWQIKRRRNA